MTGTWRARCVRWWWRACWAFVAALALLVLLRSLWHDGAWVLLVANAMTLYLFLPVHALAAIAALRQRGWLFGAAALLAIWHLWQVAPELASRTPPDANGPVVRLVTANLFASNTTPTHLAEELGALDADVILLQELTPLWVDALREAGVLERYPHQTLAPRDDTAGTGLLSRRAVRDARTEVIGEIAFTTAHFDLAGKDVEMLNVHAPPPIPDRWNEHQLMLGEVLAWTRNRQGRSFIVGGDFNATPYSAFFSEMRTMSVDAWTLAGNGLGHTAPNGHGGYPPVRIDHFFLSPDLTAVAAGLGQGEGSDHRPLAADVALRRW